MPSTGFRACPLRAQVDPRLLRFSAGATASVLAVVLLIVGVARPLALGLLASQVAVFAFTAFVSFQWSLWAQIFARVIWPRIGAPTELEDARPHRFGQFVGFLFTALALISFALGVDVAALGLTALTFGVAARRIHRGLPGLQGLPADPPIATGLSLVRQQESRDRRRFNRARAIDPRS